MILNLLKKNISFSKSDKIKAPGNIRKHYSPGIPIKLNSKDLMAIMLLLLLEKIQEKKALF